VQPQERLDRWRGLEEAQRLGLTKHIGVSNYGVHHMQEIFNARLSKPLVNQVEVHVFLSRVELVEFCQSHGVIVEAYSPLAKASAMDDATLKSVAHEYGKSVAQIMLRYLIQRGLVVLPKSVHTDRIKENMLVFDFELSSATMQKLLALNRNMCTGWDPTTSA